MNKYSLVSSKKLIAEVIGDFNITNDDWVSKAQRHISRGIALMEIDGYFQIQYHLATVEEYRAALPCDNKYLVAVVCPDAGFTRLPLTRSLSLGVEFADVPLHNILQGTIQYNYLKTNFETGRVLFIYYGIPKNHDGELLIPDNDFVFEALPFYIIYKLSFSGYVHPVLDWKTADAKWKETYPRASNVMNFPSIEEMDRFTKMNTNPLFMDIVNEDWGIGTGLSTLSVRDFIEAINVANGGSTDSTVADQWEETI